MLLLASERTLTGTEEGALSEHLATCEQCRELEHDTRKDGAWRWVARLPDDAFEDPDALVLPTVDPIVFTGEQQIASGGMGRISKAHDRRLGREVAIKEMLEPDQRARFEREATITARLQHPAIVPIYEAGTWPNGGAFYTMRLVSGGTLAAAIEKCSTLEERLRLLPHVVAATEALAYAHAQRVIHRDLKPHNVLVGEFGETVVIDWGLAKELDRSDVVDPSHAHGEDVGLTLEGSVIGTPCFMAPEQANGELLDARADVYALGAILYNVLSGRPPYYAKGMTTDALIAAVLTREPEPLDDDVPADLAAVVARAMQRSPADRYATAKEMAEELRRFQSGQLLRSREYSLRDLLVRWIIRHKAPVAVGALAAVALAVVGVVALRNVTRSRDAARAAETQTERSVTSLLEEQGRSELVAGRRGQALAYLAEAYSRGRDTPALRHMLAAATRDLDLFVGTLAGDSISAISYLPDGRLALFTMGEDATLQLARGDKIETTYHLGGQYWARFSPDGTRLLTSTSGESASMWDTASGKTLWTVAGEVNEVDFAPRSPLVAVMASHAGATIYDVETGALLLTIPDKYKVTDVAFDGNGLLLIAIGDKGSCVFYSKNKDGTWQELPFEGINRPWVDAQFVGKGLDVRVVMTTSDREVLLWTMEGPVPFRSVGAHRSKITALVSSVPNDIFASGDASGDVQLWNREGVMLGQANDAHQPIRELAFTHDRKTLIGVGDDPGAFVWNSSLGLGAELVAPGSEVGSLSAIAIAPDDKQFAILDGEGDHVRLWRPPVTNVVATHAGTAAAIAGQRIAIADTRMLVVMNDRGAIERQIPLLFVPDKSTDLRARMVVAGDRALVFGDQGAGVYDLVSGAAYAVPHDPANDPSMTTWQLSKHYVVEIGDKKIRVLDVAKLPAADHWESSKPLPADAVVLTRDQGEAASSGELSPDESKLVLTGAKQWGWHLPDGAELKLPPLAFETIAPLSHPEASDDLVWSPAGDRIVVVGVTAPFLLDASGATITRLKIEAPATSSVEIAKFSPDGSMVMTQLEDSASVWSAATGKLIFTVRDVSARGIAIANDFVATGNADGIVRIWDRTGRLIETLKSNRGAIATIAFSADGARLMAQDSRRATTVWDIHLEQRSPAEIKVLADRSPWRVVDGTLTKK
ncbi:MAG: WD40 repeat domain-containing serine/threonine-protein kinase [Kofleriaceae bacterium]